ncbi:MAG: LysR family transcriptional regulator, partial [Rhodoblastus sp.]|nr:LysR family transcriptional regulator [Rhodoblastus sp.]
MFDFKEIETFYWVATLGSFRAAAGKLNTTQPAISQRIAGLEQTLGARVLSRDARLVAPTPRGRELLVYAEKLLGLRAEMLAAVGDVSTTRGVLRLGVAET